MSEADITEGATESQVNLVRESVSSKNDPPCWTSVSEPNLSSLKQFVESSALHEGADILLPLQIFTFTGLT